MKPEFTPISLAAYVELHLRSNPGTDRADLVKRLRYTMDAKARGERCACGQRVWIIGSAEVGLSCFTCITGEACPDSDYEIVADEEVPSGPSVHLKRCEGARR
jgi:hypothetical protein